MPSSQLAQQIRQQVSCESLDDEAGTGASIASLRSAGSSWEMNSWELDPSEVQICLDSKNRPWKLGSGGFGSVSLMPIHEPLIRVCDCRGQELICSCCQGSFKSEDLR